MVCAAPSSQGLNSSHSFPAPLWDPSHRRRFPTNMSNIVLSHSSAWTDPVWILSTDSFQKRLLQCESLQQDQSFRNSCSSFFSLGSLRDHESFQQTCSRWASLSPARTLLQLWLPMGSQPPLCIHLLQCGILTGYRGISFPQGLQGYSCLTLGSIIPTQATPYFYDLKWLSNRKSLEIKESNPVEWEVSLDQYENSWLFMILFKRWHTCCDFQPKPILFKEVRTSLKGSNSSLIRAPKN